MSESAAAYETSAGGLSFSRTGPRLGVQGSWVYQREAQKCCSSQTQGNSRVPLSIRESRKLPESLLHAAWRRVTAASLAITGRDGHRYRVIYPGRPADGAGPDFRDAILLRDDGLRLHGHVEMHVRSADWHGHGHTTDRAYNGVVLHVVDEDSGLQIDTPSGVHIPLLVLDRSLVRQAAPMSGSRSVDQLPSAVPLQSLDMGAAGDAWFRNRVHGYLLQFVEGLDQALWEGALECLGYPSNKKGFRQLAARLPFSTVVKLARSMSREDLQDTLKWAAGLADKPRHAPMLNGKAPEWCSRHGRPANSPKARLHAVTAWAMRWSGCGSPGSLAETFVQAVSEARSAGQLASLFTVGTDRSAPRGRSGGKSAARGLSRARDIVVNHMLPSVCAIATMENDDKLASQARRLFKNHPLLASNSITREASLLLQARGANGKARTAREQQGLIHIYRMAVASQRPESQLPLV